MSHDLHKVRVRTALTPRREPYWAAPLGRGRTLGFRKIGATTGSWVARMRNETGHKVYKALGYASEAFDWDAAREAALAWFASQDAGVSSDDTTVEAACRKYVEHLTREKGDASGHDAHMRFVRTVYGDKKHPKNAIASIHLDKIRAPRLKAWRDELTLGKASSNRTLTALKAALNLAVSNRLVHPIAAREWGDVKPHKGAHKRRDVFLDLAQRRALLEAASGAVRDLMQAVALTGARAGELTGAKVSQFDKRTGTMTFIGKTGRRDVPLSPDAMTLFERLARSKLPGAYLCTRDDGKPWAHSDWDELVRAAAEAARVPEAGKEPAKLPKKVCLYTLRHSFITQALTGGMSTLDVARLCGTSLVMIEKNYGHLVSSAARERLAKVAML